MINKKIIFIISFFGILFLFTDCNSKRILRKQTEKFKESVNVDSVIFRVPKVSEVSHEILKIIDILILEKERTNRLADFPVWTPYIIIGASTSSDKSILITMSQDYISTFLFPGEAENNTSYPNIYPVRPTIIGVQKYKGYPIIYQWSMEQFNISNTLGNPKLIRVTNDSTNISTYALKDKKSDEWIYLISPSLSVQCDVNNSRLIFNRIDYYDGTIYYKR